ncbi:MAG: hypothetical protein M0Q43_01795, partial [Methanothrix sp.]|nr:hypothetical protein [Methanothrix sp.]
MTAFSSAQAAKLPSTADQKIDPQLSEVFDQEKVGKIPVIVMLQANASSSNPDRLISEDLISNDLTVRYRYRLIPGIAGEATAKSIKKIAESDRVSGIYFDGRTQISSSESSSDENSSLQESISQEGYNSPAQIIKAYKLWEKGIDGQGITVAVIDSGIDKNHPDLIG